jgi:hypothetical protein
MVRVLALLGAGLLAMVVAVPAAGAEPAGAVVVRGEYQCIVGWDDASTQLDTGVYDEACMVTNVRQPDGTFTQVLRGEIPAGEMGAFRAAGSPSSFATGCLVNYGWLKAYHDGEDWSGLMVFTSSVRHFTPDGKMTEVCDPSAGAVVVHERYLCNVGWAEPWAAEDPACDIQNVLRPDGTFTQVLHGQIPSDQMDAYRAAGSPTGVDTGCLVNYGWLMKYHQGEDWGPLMVFTSSVRHFTPDGAMTEVCAPSSLANMLP